MFGQLRRDQWLMMSCIVACCLLSPGWHPFRFLPASDEPLENQPTPRLLPIVPIPELRNEAVLSSLNSRITAQSVYVMDASSGAILYQKNATQPRPPASLVKLMTSLVALPRFQSTDGILMTAEATQEGTLAGLQVGERYSRDDMLAATLIASGNEAADQLALSSSNGQRSVFVDQMNVAAKTYHLSDQTRFTNPSGLDDDRQSMSARDTAILSKVVLQDPTLREITSTARTTIADQISHRQVPILTTNQLLGQFGVTGIKTGTTEAAGENLSLAAERDGHQVIVIILGSQHRYQDAQQILDGVWLAYRWVTPPLELLPI